MMGHRGILKSGLEYDALTGWRKVLRFRAGERKFIKRKYNKRQRYFRKMELLQQG